MEIFRDQLWRWISRHSGHQIALSVIFLYSTVVASREVSQTGTRRLYRQLTVGMNPVREGFYHLLFYRLLKLLSYLQTPGSLSLGASPAGSPPWHLEDDSATNLLLAPTGAKRDLVCIRKQVLIPREGNKFGAARLCYPFYRQHADPLQHQEHLPGQDPPFLPGEELLNFQPSETWKAW